MAYSTAFKCTFSAVVVKFNKLASLNMKGRIWEPRARIYWEQFTVARFFGRQAANVPRKVAQIRPNICACIKWKKSPPGVSYCLYDFPNVLFLRCGCQSV